MGGGALCSRRHSPRSSKIVEAESRASDSAISIDEGVLDEFATPREDPSWRWIRLGTVDRAVSGGTGP
jgi:hypothetical protein